MSPRTLVVAGVALALLAGLGLAGCDSGHSPTVRQTTLAAGDVSPTSAADTGDLPDGHPKIERPPRKRPHPLTAPAPDQKPAAESGGAKPPAPAVTETVPDSAAEVAAEKPDPLPAVAANPAAKAQPNEESRLPAPGPKGSAGSKPSAKATGPAEAGSLESRQVQMGNLRLEAPKAWLRKKPPIDFILAEFVLPRAPGDPEDAQLTVTAVGPNSPKRLDQLREELKKSPGHATVEYLTISGVEVILVDASANYGEMPGVFAPEVREGRYRVLNAIVPVGEKLYFVNCSGPEKTVGNYARQFRDFLLGMKAGTP